MVLVLAALGVALVYRAVARRGGAACRSRPITSFSSGRKSKNRRGRQENLRLLANVTLDHGLNLCARGEANHGLLLLAPRSGAGGRSQEPELGRVARVNLAVWRRRLVTPRACCTMTVGPGPWRSVPTVAPP